MGRHLKGSRWKVKLQLILHAFHKARGRSSLTFNQVIFRRRQGMPSTIAPLILRNERTKTLTEVAPQWVIPHACQDLRHLMSLLSKAAQRRFQALRILHATHRAWDRAL